MSALETCQALFINSGILGHKSVFSLLQEAMETDAEISACYLNLSDNLTASDKVIRRLLCFQALKRSKFSQHNLDLARWRQEFHAGLLAARRIRAIERRGKRFDVLHFHTQATAYFSLRRMSRTPSIVSIDCTQSLASEAASSELAKKTYRPNIIHDGHVFRRAAAIISISEWAVRDLRQTYPDCSDKVLVLPYPVRVQSFDPAWIEERYARSLKNARAPVRLLFMGGDFERKGGPELLKAWHAGRFDHSAELDLVTDWPLDESRLPPGVRVIKNIKPYTAEWSELWRRADAFVMPTRNEAFGMVYQEAGAAGIPAIGTRLSAIPEIIEDKKTGLLVSAFDIAGLTSAMRTLIESAALRRRMGEAARRRVEKIFAPELYSERLTTLIKNLARKHSSANEPERVRQALRPPSFS